MHVVQKSQEKNTDNAVAYSYSDIRSFERKQKKKPSVSEVSVKITSTFRRLGLLTLTLTKCQASAYYNYYTSSSHKNWRSS